VKELKYVPAERNTICTVSGTLYAYTRLFNSEPDAKVVTWSNHCAMGTCRGLSLGSQDRDSDDASHVKKEGSCCAVMKSICENVSAGPALVSEGEGVRRRRRGRSVVR
jgi:hypothetical protein